MNKATRLLLILACAGVLSLFTASATPNYCPTTATSLTYFIGLGSAGCQIGDKIFSNFEYTPSGTAIDQEPVGDINVTTLGPNPGTMGEGGTSSIFSNDIGVQFGGTWAASTGDGGVTNAKSDGQISFNVSVVGGGPLEIEDAGLVETGFVTGTGSATVGENGCSNPNSGGNPCTQEWGVVTNSSNFATDTIFTPTGTIGVTKDISTTSGANGTASITGVADVFSQTAVPEPRTISMFLGLGLAAAVSLKKKFQRS
jgi:hypothetical protein